MALRPARTVRNMQRPWTRTTKRVVKKAFVKGVPDSKIRLFEMGNTKNLDKYDLLAELVSGMDCQIRHNAFEAARIAANKHFETKIQRENYLFKVHVYPHHVLREHAILTGAGADRLSSGMTLAFGRPSGRAAQVRQGQTIMSIRTFKKYEALSKSGLRKAASRMPGTPKIRVSAIKKKKLILAYEE